MNPKEFLNTEPDFSDSVSQRAMKNAVHYQNLAEELGLDPSVPLDEESLMDNRRVLSESGKLLEQNEDRGYKLDHQRGGEMVKEQKPRYLEDGEEVRQEKRRNLQ